VIAIKKIWKPLTFVVAITAFILFFHYTDLFHAIRKGEVDEITAIFKNNFGYAIVISLLIMIVQNSFTIIPLILVITLNYYSFGFIYGFLWSWISSVIAGMVIFYAARYWFQDFVIGKVTKHKDMLEKIEQKGMRYVLYGRVFPFFPTSLLNIMAGISHISLRSFTLGTAIGNFIYFFILCLIPFGVFSTDINPILLICIILMATVLLFFISKKRPELFKRRSKEM